MVQTSFDRLKVQAQELEDRVAKLEEELELAQARADSLAVDKSILEQALRRQKLYLGEENQLMRNFIFNIFGFNRLYGKPLNVFGLNDMMLTIVNEHGAAPLDPQTFKLSGAADAVIEMPDGTEHMVSARSLTKIYEYADQNQGIIISVTPHQ